MTTPARAIAAAAILAVTLSIVLSGATPRFLPDDPLAREPDTQDASKAEEWDIDLIIDLAINMFTRPGDKTPNVRALNINTIDEVPDSSWFTNRILARTISNKELVRGPLQGAGPLAGTWTIVAPKGAGVAPGFTMRDTDKTLWFVSFDAAGYPEAATGAIAVANRIFWALGYWQVENYFISVKPDQLVIAESAKFRPPSGRERRMLTRDLDDVLKRAHRSPDGSYRAIAARAVPGRPIGGFRYHGTRPDDPNDVVPHEHRRELRALKVFGAWTNMVDIKAGNTLDTVITDNGRGVVRHYLQDVGSTFGTGAIEPRDYDGGWELLYDGGLLWKRFITLGFYFPPWLTVPYDENLAIGRFEGETFDPEGWRPRVGVAAFFRAQPDDDFWAARRVAGFTDEMIRVVAHEGQYSDPAAEQLLAKVLIQRRDKIAAAYLPAVNPLVAFALSGDGRLSFRNAAVDAHVADDVATYQASWDRYDNATGQTTSLGAMTTGPAGSIMTPVALPTTVGSYLRVMVAAVAPAPVAWTKPLGVYFRRTVDGWQLVGLDRRGEQAGPGRVE